MIRLTLPFPPSANRYWRTTVRGSFVSTYVSAEAKDFKEQVGWVCKAAGIREPIAGRVRITVELYPARPQDWARRVKKLGAAWDDSVRCIDLDNANKVLLDALKGVAIVDDGWPVRSLHCDRMEPDEHDARVVVCIEPLGAQVVQGDLLGALA